ncbi:4-alpha-glucanotransferase [Quadrisphaera granulorum]|uniref:4-alpha-glucanotransferase n=1 Tax=Quadrisphaera granulorum TaxID=317664 RepID=A0A315ZPZ0_9ACTN|nr:4-alpha-glucanotransferase [Quadrisphaera granulorum]PWJ47362.1 4-alpha-glucanotransferase [Quadrisphaera granulorum]SZE98809.1 4-alpha-glucanotransferase [Quadrisphaera granulorum]
MSDSPQSLLAPSEGDGRYVSVTTSGPDLEVLSPVHQNAPTTAPIDPAEMPSSRLAELATAHGVATEYWDWQGGHITVSRATIVAVLSAMGISCATEDDVATALADHELAPWRRVLPPVVVVRAGHGGTVPLHVAKGAQVRVSVVLEDGATAELQRARRTEGGEWPVTTREIDGEQREELLFALPTDLPMGWHELTVTTGGGSGAVAEASAPLVVTPDRLELPADLAGAGHRWGFMTQLYSVRSRASWGLGDLADLSELLDWSGRDLGADFLLVNPLLAAEPVGHMQDSPYLPTTRRFTNPVYLRVEDVREFAYLPATDHALVEWQAEPLQTRNTDPGQLDRDAVWAAKRTALRTVFELGRSHARQAAFDAFREREGQGLADYALWAAMIEHFGPGTPWPEDARIGTPLVEHLREELAPMIEFHEWLQWQCDEQLARAQATAIDAGMALGVMHDLAVGVHPSGADAWALRDVLATGVSVGAPPDAFNQQGQDWSQPPWQPVALAEAGYAPWRDMVRTILRHAGGVRVDHVLGLFRLWWVPNGSGPGMGTYVRYDHDALVGILCLEAARAGAVVVGEDLGLVEPWVRGYLTERGVLGTSVLWFEKDGEGKPLPPQSWRELCLATVNTHDLPPTAGYLAGEHIELRDRLGLLTRSIDEERAADEADRAAVMAQLRELGLLGEQPTEREVVEALHAFLLATPAKLVGVALTDAVGDRRTQNQPGTSDEYPNWRVPLTDGSGQVVLLEELRERPRVISLAELVGRSDD